MAKVELDEKEFLVILTKSSRDPLLRLTVDDASTLVRALQEKAQYLEGLMGTGDKLVMPKAQVADVWGAKIGYFEGGVAIQFSKAGTRIPLPPRVAQALANRIQAGINAAITGFSISINGKTPTQVFRPQQVVG